MDQAGYLQNTSCTKICRSLLLSMEELHTNEKMDGWMTSFIFVSSHLHEAFLMGLFRNIPEQQTKHSDMYYGWVDLQFCRSGLRTLYDLTKL